MWGATPDGLFFRLTLLKFQSTLPVWGATKQYSKLRSSLHISIHAPRVGSDINMRCKSKSKSKFQSTLPVWGATVYRWDAFGDEQISIHAPRVGSDRHCRYQWCLLCNFNPRSPCGERPETKKFPFVLSLFQSTLPVWGATNKALEKIGVIDISIHAPRVGSDRPP